jgi:flagellar export protein FliJ
MTKQRSGLARMLTRAQIHEDAAQRELAASVRESEARHAAMLQREAQLRDAQARQATARNASSFQQARTALAASARAIEDATLAAAAADDDVRGAQVRLVERSRERKTLERLDERGRALLATNASKAAQRSLDDFANRRRNDS